MNKNIILALIFLAIGISGYCAQPGRITLNDGSVINGEVISFANGTYTINTVSFGEVKIDGARVVKIESAGLLPSDAAFVPGAQPGNLDLSLIEGYTQKIMNNPQNAAAIRNLADSPQIQELAKDPEIISAIKSGNIQALLNNKKFNDVVKNPEVGEAAKEIKP